MTMKTARLILACGLAAITAPAAEELRPSTLNIPGIPTPLEEYGLSIGDVTVSRVINPLGQLRAGSPVTFIFSDLFWLALASYLVKWS